MTNVNDTIKNETEIRTLKNEVNNLKNTLQTVTIMMYEKGQKLEKIKEQQKQFQHDYDDIFGIQEGDVEKAKDQLRAEPYQRSFVVLHVAYVLDLFKEILKKD